MIVKPKVRGFICTTAHPVGCEAVVKSEIDYVKSKKAEDNGFKPKKVLVLGSSMGYGLASRISLAFAGGAATLGVMFDRPASGNKTGTSGWYNTQAFEKYAKADGLYARTVNGDAYSDECKKEVIDIIKALKEYNVNITVYDPWANPAIARREYGIEVVNALPEVKFDACIAAVAHKKFEELTISDLLKPRHVIFDVKTCCDRKIIDGRL